MGKRIKKNLTPRLEKNQATLLQLGFTKMVIKNENQKKPENEKQHNSIGRFLSIRIGSYLPLCRKVKE